MTTTIAFANQKGGVGKTTTVHNVGSALSQLGNKVLLVDLDPQSSLTILCLDPQTISNLDTTLTGILLHGADTNKGIQSVSKNLDIIPCDTELAYIEKVLNMVEDGPVFLKSALEEVTGYDYILIDCPPQLSQLTLNGLTASDWVIVPTQAEYLATKGLEQLKTTISSIQQNSNENLAYKGVIITKFRRNTLHTQEIRAFLKETEPLIGTVRESIKVSDSVYESLPVVFSSPKHPTAIAYKAIAKRISGSKLTKAEEVEIDE